MSEKSHIPVGYVIVKEWIPFTYLKDRGAEEAEILEVS